MIIGGSLSQSSQVKSLDEDLDTSKTTSFSYPLLLSLLSYRKSQQKETHSLTCRALSSRQATSVPYRIDIRNRSKSIQYNMEG